MPGGERLAELGAGMSGNRYAALVVLGDRASTRERLAWEAQLTEPAAGRLLEVLMRESLVTETPRSSGEPLYALTAEGTKQARKIIEASGGAGQGLETQVMKARAYAPPAPPPPRRRAAGGLRRIRRPVGKRRGARPTAKQSEAGERVLGALSGTTRYSVQELAASTGVPGREVQRLVEGFARDDLVRWSSWGARTEYWLTPPAVVPSGVPAPKPMSLSAKVGVGVQAVIFVLVAAWGIRLLFTAAHVVDVVGGLVAIGIPLYRGYQLWRDVSSGKAG